MAKFTVISSEKTANGTSYKTAFGVLTDNAPSFAVGVKAWMLTNVQMELGSTHLVADRSFVLESRTNENGTFQQIVLR